MKKPKKDKTSEAKLPGIPLTPKEQAKEMARAARQVARMNGKRITMSMFVIEDLV